MDNLKEKALKLELKGDYKEAAKIYRKAGRAEKAAYLYQKSGDVDTALAIYREEKLWLRAGEVCFKLERYEEAGDFFLKAQDLIKAADAYERGSAHEKAGGTYAQMGRADKAAAMYLKAGCYLKAGALFEESGDTDAAVHAYKRYLLEQKVTPGELSTREAVRIGAIFEKAGEPERAAELMLRAGEHEKAFHLALVAGRADTAAEIYREHLPGQGYHLMSLATGDEELINRYGEFFLENGEPDIASMAFEKVENWARAAESYRRAGNVEAAAELYYKCGMYEEAAAGYEEAGRYGTAADTYYKLQKMAPAAENYERDGDYYKAGRLYQFLGDNEKAVSLLQRIEPEAPEYMKATGIIAQAFIEIGLTDLARKRIDEVIEAYDLSHDNIDFFIEIAQALEAIGDLQRCREILGKVVSIDFSRERARNLLMAVQKRIEKGSTPPRSSTAQAAAPPDGTTSSAPAAAPRMTRGMQVLKKLSFFKPFRDEDIPHLWESIKREVIAPQTDLITSGRFTTDFFVLAKGEVLILSAMDAQLGVINVMGSAFGLIAAMSGEESSVTFRSHKECAVLRVTRDSFLNYLATIQRRQGTTIGEHILASMQAELNVFEKNSIYHRQLAGAVVNLKALL